MSASRILRRTALAAGLLFVGSGCFAHYGEYGDEGYYSAGLVINTLPRGFYRFHHGGSPYYYYDGYFYRRNRRGYVSVRPPRGAIIPRLPARARGYRQGRAEYKEYRGVRYERVRNGRSRGYRVEGEGRRRGRRRR